MGVKPSATYGGMIFIRSLSFHIAFYGGTIAIAILAIPLLFAPAAIGRALGRFWGVYALGCLRIAGISIIVKGDRRLGEQVIYAATHQSTYETMILYHILAAPWVVLKKELLNLPIIGRFMKKTGAIALDRSARLSALKRLREMLGDRINSGRSFLIFPQGTRVDFGKKAPYKVGVFALYDDANLPVVPIALDTGRYLPHGKLLTKPGQVQVSFLSPIAPGLERKAFMNKLETAIERELEQFQKEVL